MVVTLKLLAGIKIVILAITTFTTCFIIGMVMKVSGTQISIVSKVALKLSAGLQSLKFTILSSTKLNTTVFRLAANVLRIKNRFNVFYTLLAVVRI